MTGQAKLVLEDCKAAIADIKNVQGSEWRRRWITVVVLLRTVGYVLKNVDSKQSKKMKDAIDAKWESLKSTNPEPKILWQFIEEERNNIIHEYKINAGQGINKISGGPLHFLYTIPEGPYKGRDQREVALEAIEFWENYLTEIELCVKG